MDEEETSSRRSPSRPTLRNLAFQRRVRGSEAPSNNSHADVHEGITGRPDAGGITTMMSKSAYAAPLFLSSALGLIVLGGQARAAEAPDQPAAAASTVQEVVVTGSALPSTPDAVAVPVSTINASSIVKNG